MKYKYIKNKKKFIIHKKIKFYKLKKLKALKLYQFKEKQFNYWLNVYRKKYKKLKNNWYNYLKKSKKYRLLFRNLNLGKPLIEKGLKKLKKNIIIRKKKLIKYRYYIHFIKFAQINVEKKKKMFIKYRLKELYKKWYKRKKRRFFQTKKFKKNKFNEKLNKLFIKKNMVNLINYTKDKIELHNLLKNSLKSKEQKVSFKKDKEKKGNLFKRKKRKIVERVEALLSADDTKKTTHFNKLFLLKFLKKRLKEREDWKKKIKICYIILKQNNNNFFIIITDLNGKVINYKWAGQFNETFNIKNKRSYFLVFPLGKYIINVLKKYNINHVIIRLRSNINFHMHKFMFILQQNGIKVRKIINRRPIPHHLGQRKKKLRRL